MGRASKQQAADHHDAIIAAASHRFRERGIKATSVPEIMGDAGLTHGGFYGHFASKEALAAAAARSGFDWLKGWLDAISERHPGDPAGARRELVETYLRPAHRDNPGAGCPAVALGGDVARELPESPVRVAYTDGIAAVVEQLTAGFAEDSRRQALADYATLIGAMVLARATAGDPISDEVLAAAREALTAGRS